MNRDESRDKFSKDRRQMVESDLKGRNINDPAVLKVLAEIAREDFVPAKYRRQAYADGPLPIECGQTISQPYIVALMTQELRLNPDSQVLEIGTGSGYQTAVLSRLAKKVYTIEKYSQLSESSRALLGRMGIDNVEFFVGDGSIGWPVKKIFDRIIVTAAVPSVPQLLIDQLAQGGVLIAPVGHGAVQHLMVCRKSEDKVVEKAICDVRFVKLVGEYGFGQ